jgi:hypothetical protein
MRGILWLSVLSGACAANSPPPPPQVTAPESAPPVASAPAATNSLPPVSSSEPASRPAPAPALAAPEGCGDQCLAFPSSEDAFDYVLARAPRILAVGEAHAQKGTEAIKSATRRFAERLLPRLQGRASDLVIELMIASGKCGNTERKVQEQQRPVTQNQTATAQNEFVTLGHRAKALGIQPHPLTPSCEEYGAVTRAGQADVAVLLETVARITARQAKALLGNGKTAMVVTYGGAIHNDVAPRAGRESWSFGPELSGQSQGAYVELDLIVPEYVKDTEAWRAMPWYDAFSKAPTSPAARLITTGPASYVLIFPNTKQ